MKQYLEIKSFGEIDIQAFTLIGASTKRGNSAMIGMYGSGNKYSIATLLNQGIGILLFLVLFSPILLFGNEQSFLRVINKLHELINNQ